MRQVFGTLNLTSTTTAVQVDAAARPYVLQVTFRARDGNSGALYIGNSSVAVADGYELAAGDEKVWDFSRTGAVSKDTWWAISTGSSDKLDFAMVVED